MLEKKTALKHSPNYRVYAQNYRDPDKGSIHCGAEHLAVKP